MSAYCSSDGKTWVSLGKPINAANLDKAQPGFNSWVGTSIGLFAEGKFADFDFFICKDGTSALPAVGYSNFYGVTRQPDGTEAGVTNTSVYGGWFMLSGVEVGSRPPAAVSITANARVGGQLEIWLDDLEKGTLIASIPIKRSTGWKSYRIALKKISGQHDVFVKFRPGTARGILVKTIQFLD